MWDPQRNHYMSCDDLIGAVYIQFYCVTISNIPCSLPCISLFFHVSSWYIRVWFPWTHALFKLLVLVMTIEWVQEIYNSIANVLESILSCTNPSIWYLPTQFLRDNSSKLCWQSTLIESVQESMNCMAGKHISVHRRNVCSSRSMKNDQKNVSYWLKQANVGNIKKSRFIQIATPLCLTWYVWHEVIALYSSNNASSVFFIAQQTWANCL